MANNGRSTRITVSTAIPVMARSVKRRRRLMGGMLACGTLFGGIPPAADLDFVSGMFSQAMLLAGCPRVTLHTMSRASALTTMVTKNKANPISINAERYRLPVASVNSLASTLAMVYPGANNDLAISGRLPITMVTGNRPEIAKSLFAPGYTMASVLANEFTEATGNLYLSALIEIGLALFFVTIVVNALARLMVWSVTRGQPARSIA